MYWYSNPFRNLLWSATSSISIICTSAWNWTCTRIIREGHHGEEGNSFFLLGYTDCHKGQENAKFYFHFAWLCLSPKGWLTWVQTPMSEENRGMPIGNTPLLPWKASSMPRTQIPVRWVKTWWKIYHQVFPLSLSDDIFFKPNFNQPDQCTCLHTCCHPSYIPDLFDLYFITQNGPRPVWPFWGGESGSHSSSLTGIEVSHSRWSTCWGLLSCAFVCIFKQKKEKKIQEKEEVCIFKLKWVYPYLPLQFNLHFSRHFQRCQIP